VETGIHEGPFYSGHDIRMIYSSPKDTVIGYLI